MNLHQADLTRRMTEFLSRRTAPKTIAGSAEAQKAEIASLVRAVMRHAPRDGLQTWWQEFEDALLARMKTHGWPIQSEIDAAAKAIRREGSANPLRSLDLAADYARTHGKPLPWANTPEYTYHLTQMRVLSSLREARFKGFALSQEQNRIALDQRMTDDEFEHHCEVMARLRGVDIFDVRTTEAQMLGR